MLLSRETGPRESLSFTSALEGQTAASQLPAQQPTQSQGLTLPTAEGEVGREWSGIVCGYGQARWFDS